MQQYPDHCTTFYDPNAETDVETDTSQEGYRAVTMQRRHDARNVCRLDGVHHLDSE